MSRPPRAGVLGLGLIGGSLLQALGAAGAEPTGWDADPGVVAGAARAGFAVAEDAAGLAAACDVVIVCVPPAATAPAAAELLAARPGLVVADAASVKAPVLAGVRELVGAQAAQRFVAAHPLAGSERTGWEAADPALLRDAVWAVCPSVPDASAEPLCALSAVLDAVGARLLVCDAAEHDAAVARTSHVPHVVAQALARAPGGDLAAALSGGAYRDMTRTATADHALWTAILLANREAVVAALRELGGELEAAARAVEAGDAPALGAAWRDGARVRARVEALRWREPTWRAQTLTWPAWEELLAHGRAGAVVRRLRPGAGGTLALDVAVT